MEYLRAIKYPLSQMIGPESLSDDMLFIEHIAEQAILSAKSGACVTPDVYDLLDRAGVALVRAASIKPATDEQARIFEKIMAAVQLNSPGMIESKSHSMSVAYISNSSGSAEE